MDEDTLLTDAEVSEMLGNIPRSTLRACRTRGSGRVIRLAPRTPRYRLRDVRAWIASCTSGGPAVMMADLTRAVRVEMAGGGR